MDTAIETRSIAINTEFGELVDVPATINFSEVEAEIVSAEMAGGKMVRDELIKLAGKAEIEQIESDLFDLAIEQGLVETADYQAEVIADYQRGTGFPFGPLAGHF